MKVVAVSDLHGNLNRLDFGGYDLVVMAGDIAPLRGFGRWDVYRQLKWVNVVFGDFTDRFPNTQFVIIPGNHDLFAVAGERFGGTDEWICRFGGNVKMLIDETFEFRGLKIYGTPWIPVISHSWAFESERRELSDSFSKIPYGLDVLITHSPPRIDGETVDYSLQNGRGPFGSAELANAIFDKKPKTVFCGHIHSGNHEPTDFGNSRIVNVSRLDERYEIAYDPFELEISQTDAER